MERQFTERQLFEAAYGDATGAEYWDTFLSEPTLPNGLASTYASHLVQEEGEYQVFYDHFSLTLVEMSKDGVLSPLKIDYKDNSNWIVGEKIDPVFVTNWLLERPKRRHWVPKSLARFIQADSLPIETQTKHSPLKVEKEQLEAYCKAIGELGLTFLQVEKHAHEHFDGQHIASTAMKAAFKLYPGKRQRQLPTPLRRGRMSESIG